MKKRMTTVLFAVVLTMSICACGGGSGQTAGNSKNSIGSGGNTGNSSGTNNVSGQNQRSQSNAPILSVRPNDSKHADITVKANGGTYYGYEISMFDPGLENSDKGNRFSVTLTSFEGSDSTCQIMETYSASGDYPTVFVKYDDLGNGDYVLHVTLPKDRNISFNTIEKYGIMVQKSKSTAIFDSIGTRTAAEVMEGDPASIAQASDEGEILSEIPYTEYEKMCKVIDTCVGSFKDKDNNSLQISGESGSYVFWADIGGSNGGLRNITVNPASQDTTMTVRGKISKDNAVTIDIKGDQNSEVLKDVKATFVFREKAVEVQYKGKTYSFK